MWDTSRSFFFSSRRRHTRYWRDWSSDVCSSDLTASGDADHYVVRFYRRFSPSCETSHLSLFRRDQGAGGVEEDLATHLVGQDVIYVGGGNVVSMLGAWSAHGLDCILRDAWRRGVVLCG